MNVSLDEALQLAGLIVLIVAVGLLAGPAWAVLAAGLGLFGMGELVARGRRGKATGGP